MPAGTDSLQPFGRELRGPWAIDPSTRQETTALRNIQIGTDMEFVRSSDKPFAWGFATVKQAARSLGRLSQVRRKSGRLPG